MHLFGLFFADSHNSALDHIFQSGHLIVILHILSHIDALLLAFRVLLFEVGEFLLRLLNSNSGFDLSLDFSVNLLLLNTSLISQLLAQRGQCQLGNFLHADLFLLRGGFPGLNLQSGSLFVVLDVLVHLVLLHVQQLLGVLVDLAFDTAADDGSVLHAVVLEKHDAVFPLLDFLDVVAVVHLDCAQLGLSLVLFVHHDHAVGRFGGLGFDVLKTPD